MRTKIEKLQAGETFVTIETCNIVPGVKCNEKFILTPISKEEIKVNDVICFGRRLSYGVVININPKSINIITKSGIPKRIYSNIHGKILH